MAADEIVYPMTERIGLWPGRVLHTDTRHHMARKNEITRIRRETRPSLEFYPSDSADSNAPTVIILPGGGYSTLAYDLEGTEIAQWLNSIGVHALILRYSVPSRGNAPHYDAQRAIRLVKYHAPRWNLDYRKIGVMGFSAGGHLAAYASSNWNQAYYEPVDEVDELSSRPDFTALVYPAYLSPRNEVLIRDDLDINSKTPPAFIVHTLDDHKYINSSMAYNQALQDAGIESTYFLVDQGGHGFGVRLDPDSDIGQWPQQFESWLQAFD